METMTRHLPTSRRLAPVVVLAVAAACSSGHSRLSTATGSSGDTSTSTSASAPPPIGGSTASTSAGTAALPIAPTTTAPTVTKPTSTTSTGVATQVSLSEADNGRSLSVHPGDTVTIVLHSTYWSFLASSNPAAVQAQGAPVVVPTLQGCVPGGGCGTVTAHYRAVADGQAALAAHRETCGEALACAPNQKDWRVVITVTG
jgi:hypothetical protein